MSDPRARATNENSVHDEAITDYRKKRSGGLTLQPGQISSELITALAVAFPADELISEIRMLMRAEVVTKGGMTLPDNRTRLAATQLLFNYLEGRPVERIISASTTQTLDPDADLAMRLKKSPALRRMMKRMISEAEADEIEVETVV